MVTKIQKKLRIKFGKIFRAKMKENMERAAAKIQCFYRARKIVRWFRPFYYGTRLSNFLGAIQRRTFAADDSAEKMRHALRVHASRLIQRIYRGYRGRVRTLERKEFFRSIATANNRVSLKELVPGHLDELCFEIEYFLRDYTRNLPIEVLSVLRGVLYMLNGEKAEMITIESAGVMEIIEVRAHDLAWNGCKHLLRRRGRFLRRLRALAKVVKQPNASMLA